MILQVFERALKVDFVHSFGTVISMKCGIGNLSFIFAACIIFAIPSFPGPFQFLYCLYHLIPLQWSLHRFMVASQCLNMADCKILCISPEYSFCTE